MTEMEKCFWIASSCHRIFMKFIYLLFFKEGYIISHSLWVKLLGN